MNKSRQQLKSEGGWVMVPVIILMVAAMGVAFALLAIVDTQTGQSREQRSRDASQTLAEGVVSSTANILADRTTAQVWRVAACEQITGDLSHASSAPSTSFAARVTKELQDRFADLPEYQESASHKTTWRVNVCPVAASDTRWQDGYLTRGAVTPSSGVGKLWVRAQASARSATAAARAQNTRAVASQVTQNATPFPVPAGYAVGTGAFSSDVGVALNNTTSKLLGGALTQPLIKDTNKKIGVRCGLLTTINNLSTTCVTGALSGVGGTTNALGLGALNSALGVDRAQTLGTWSMAPRDAIEAWRAEAQPPAGIYAETVPGYGDVRTKSVSGTRRDCFSGTPTAAQVIFIEKVGNGEEYCDVNANTTAKMLVIGRGGVRISAQFTGVVYALNLQECGEDGTCNASEREHAVPREVVRIEGNTGKVTGSVWADGAGGQVGIYPKLDILGVNSALNQSLLNLGGPQGICGLPLVGPLLDTVGNVLDLVSGLLTDLLATRRMRYVDPATGLPTTTRPSGCAVLRRTLGGLTTSQLANLFGAGDSVPVLTAFEQTRPNLLTGWPSTWTPVTTATTIPSLLQSGTPSLIEQVVGVLGQTLSGYTAVEYNEAVVSNAGTHISQGAAPIIGTYRNLAPAA